MRKTIKMIGIAGGSGSGKSTLAIALYKAHSKDCALIHVDDYFQKKEDAPIKDDLVNWDHPDALRLNDLYRDLLLLKSGKEINILTKSELYNPDYKPELGNKIAVTIRAKPLIILEGYLALHDTRIRELLDLKIYLDMPILLSAKRRSGNKFVTDEIYLTKILGPMHQEFVRPTKNYADLVINVSRKNKDEVLSIAEDKIFTQKIIGAGFRLAPE